jgi:hypothetical protein
VISSGHKCEIRAGIREHAVQACSLLVRKLKLIKGVSRSIGLKLELHVSVVGPDKNTMSTFPTQLSRGLILHSETARHNSVDPANHETRGITGLIHSRGLARRSDLIVVDDVSLKDLQH